MDVLIQPLLSLTSLNLKSKKTKLTTFLEKAYYLFLKSILPFSKKVGIFNNRVSLNTILMLLKHHLNAVLIA